MHPHAQLERHDDEESHVDSTTYRNLARQCFQTIQRLSIVLGERLMISDILSEASAQIRFYFRGFANWYHKREDVRILADYIDVVQRELIASDETS
jgi:hypothetical protein